MVLLAFIFSCMIAGSLACTDRHCKSPALANELMEVRFLPNSRQLGRLCPKIITFLECEREFFECPGQSLDEMKTSSDKEDATKAKAMLGAISLVHELCDEDSSLHEDYIGSVNCFRSYLESAGSKCRQDIAEPVEEFFNQLYPSEEDLTEELYSEIQCLSDAYELACIIDNLGDSCGSAAQGVAMTALEKMSAFLKAGSCSDVENAADLKSRFVDFLELDEEKRVQTQGIFDLLKRRR